MSHTICADIYIYGFIVRLRLKPVQNKINLDETGISGYENKLLIVEIYKIYIILKIYPIYILEIIQIFVLIMVPDS